MLRLRASALAVVMLGGTASSQTAPDPRAPLPAEAFAELPKVEQPQISPDGTRFAAKIAINGKQYLAIMPVDGGSRTLVAAGEADLNWWRWVNDAWLIVGIGDEQNVEGRPWYISRAIGVEATTGKPQPIVNRMAAQDADDVIWMARDGSARVMIAYQTSIYSEEAGFWPRVDEVDLATGKRKQVQGPRIGVLSWYADPQGVLRMGIGISEDGRSRRLLYRDTAEAPFRTIDRAKGSESRLTVPAMFLRDKRKALIIDDDEGGYSALYELDLTTLERGKQLIASKGYDIGGLVPTEDGFGYLGVSIEEDRPEVRWTDAEMSAMQTRVSALVKGAQVEIASLSKDRSVAILRIGGADAPGAWYLYRLSENALTLHAENNGVMGMRRLHPVRTIRYKARDGLEIPAVMTLPRGRRGKLPLIVMPHGGPFARDSETWDWWPQFLADRGYAVIQPNYRGSSGFGTPFTKKGEGQWGLAMQDDLNDAVQALADLGIADSTRVCMVGGSYGGYAAMRAAQRDGAKYRCAVSYAGVSDLGRMVAHQRNFLFSGSGTDWLKKQAPDLRSVSPVNYPEQVSIPLLLMHGEKDRRVPIIQSRVMAQKLKAAGKDVTFIAQKEADHFFSRAEDRLEFLKALEAFLAKHNPA